VRPSSSKEAIGVVREDLNGDSEVLQSYLVVLLLVVALVNLRKRVVVQKFVPKISPVKL